MLTGALIKTTLIDYPGRVSCAWFLNGCSLRCPYCYSAELVYNRLAAEDSCNEQQVFDHLFKRRNVLSGFVVSGGEALIHTETADIIRKAKDLGYAVKLDTNGMHPDALERLFQDTAARPDFIALDVKTSPNRYHLLAADNGLLHSKSAQSRLQRSIICACRLAPENREFRTVLVPPLVGKKDIENIAALLPADAVWRFAPFRPENCLNPAYNDILPYSEAQMNDLVSYARGFIADSLLR